MSERSTRPVSPRSPVDRGELVTGAAAVVGGAAVLPYAISMPTAGGLPGPGLFPGMVGGLAVLLGLALVAKALLGARRGVVTAPETDGGAETGAGGLASEAVPPTAGEEPAAGRGTMQTSLAATGRQRWANAAVILGSIIFYIALAEVLGFVLTMFVILAGIMLVLRARPVPALLTAAGLTALLYAVFELGLLVQLPDGILGW